jgi:hypothetical protein
VPDRAAAANLAAAWCSSSPALARPHVAGALGAPILERIFAMRWAARIGDSRALRITTRGRDEFSGLGFCYAIPGVQAAT